MTEAVEADTVLDREQAFFDQEAAALTDRELVIDASQTRRYREAQLRPGNIPKDTLFARLNPLAGKRVLDYGCGHGESTCHLANCGAEVTAFDLSPQSVAVARRRAEVNGLAGRIRFDVRRAGETGYAPGSFDAIIGFAILHHLHEMLPTIYSEVRSLLAPGGTAYFIEPVANSRVLRRIRGLVPVSANATPDERQLQYADLELIRRHGFSGVHYDHFHCLTRLTRMTGGRGETPLRWLDYGLLRSAPFLKSWYGVVLMTANT
jgi:SAM-dependent methyltransferase